MRISVARIRLWEKAITALALRWTMGRAKVSRIQQIPHPCPSTVRPNGPAPPVSNSSTPRRASRPSIMKRFGGPRLSKILLNLVEHMGCKPAMFVVCTAAARGIPGIPIQPPYGFDRLNNRIEIFEDHLHNFC